MNLKVKFRVRRDTHIPVLEKEICAKCQVCFTKNSFSNNVFTYLKKLKIFCQKYQISSSNNDTGLALKMRIEKNNMLEKQFKTKIVKNFINMSRFYDSGLVPC